MAMLKSTIFSLIVLLFMQTINFSWSICLENERQALLSFKNGLIDPSNRLSSWVDQDCCRWEGVGCDNRTRHVVMLDLRNPFPSPGDNLNGYTVPLDDPGLHFYGPAITFNKACLRAVEVNPSLQELKHLNYLDLSWNNFSGVNIPKFFGSFQELKYLNLSSAWFGGLVPHHLGNLSALRSLDLSQSYLDGFPISNVDTLEWIPNLSSLQHLDMSGADISYQTFDLSQVITSLPSLLELRLSNCGLGEIPMFHSLKNRTSLAILDISYNRFQGPIPNAIRNMSSLKVLDVSHNQFSSKGPILDELTLNNLEILDLSYNSFETKAIKCFENFSSPSIAHSLESLSLSNNQLNGSLPNWLYQLKNLKSLDLSSNFFHGPIPIFLGELSALEVLRLGFNKFRGPIPTSFGTFLRLKELQLSINRINGTLPTFLGKLSALEVLRLGQNDLSGPIPTSLGRLSHLRELLLGNNRLSGQIPASFGRLSNLRVLSIPSNNLNGTIPEILGQLSELTLLDLSSNSLNGVLSEVHFTKLSKLKSLALTMNNLSLKIKTGWVPPFQLEWIDLGSCDLGPLFPDWLRTQTEFTYLDMSNASISDSIPIWFKNLPSQLVLLLLSSNHISGSLPHFPSNIQILDLSNNIISGPVPPKFGDMLPALTFLGLSENHISGSIPSSLCKIESLYMLDLSKNHLSGDLPRCWSNLKLLQIIDFSSNNLSGTIPSSIGQLSGLKLLRLSNNNFHGNLSSALRNCTILSVLDLGDNSLSEKIPTWIGRNLSFLEILRLRSNKFTGSIPPKLCHLTFLHILDIAHNNLSGTIPRCFGNLSGMLSSRMDNTYIPLYTERLMQVIKGRELEYVKLMNILVNLDLSSNNLVGRIPEELTRLAGLNSLNLSENYLTGNIPQKIDQMKSLESLDLSRNHLSGIIPQTISLSSRLSWLNLSYNNLSGPIPLGSQLQTFGMSSYKGNLELCGFPLEKKCFGDEPSQAPAYVVDHESASWFYIGMGPGFVLGFCGVCGILLLNKDWRNSYFRLADDIKERLLLGIGLVVKKF